MRFVAFLLLIWSCSATAMPDTAIVRQQKGILFLSSYNDDYDYNGAEVKSVGFFDYFYPDSASIKDYKLRGCSKVFFKKGVRVDRFDQRNSLKAIATELSCYDSSHCYYFDKFYLVPVIVTYKVYDDYWPFLCRRNFYELKFVDSGIIKFEYEHKLIKIITIKPDKFKRIIIPDVNSRRLKSQQDN